MSDQSAGLRRGGNKYKAEIASPVARGGGGGPGDDDGACYVAIVREKNFIQKYDCCTGRERFTISTGDFLTVSFTSTSINEQNEVDNEKGIRVYRSVRHADASDQDQRTTLPRGLRKILEKLPYGMTQRLPVAVDQCNYILWSLQRKNVFMPDVNFYELIGTAAVAFSRSMIYLSAILARLRHRKTISPRNNALLAARVDGRESLRNICSNPDGPRSFLSLFSDTEKKVALIRILVQPGPMGLEGAFGSICRLRERPLGIDIQYIHMYIGAGRRASLRSDNSPTREPAQGNYIREYFLSLVSDQVRVYEMLCLGARVDFAEEVSRFNEEITLRAYDIPQGRVRPSPLDTSACLKARCRKIPPYYSNTFRLEKTNRVAEKQFALKYSTNSAVVNGVFWTTEDVASNSDLTVVLRHQHNFSMGALFSLHNTYYLHLDLPPFPVWDFDLHLVMFYKFPQPLAQFFWPLSSHIAFQSEFQLPVLYRQNLPLRDQSGICSGDRDNLADGSERDSPWSCGGGSGGGRRPLTSIIEHLRTSKRKLHNDTRLLYNI
ncbi:hypothetical protein EAG_05668 [Camponotus floridanus]|uniref:Uncharacterized protein n=1 Tax=Camponotus floridanus TaxID=104421 RepID=E1ZXV7_CAMFO|nr:hypothetical protein EAG_05668 [Camponotus floridanus]